MRITDIREMTVPINAEFHNAVIGFSRMTVSLLALHTDVRVEGEPVIGFGFNSNGRYAQGGVLRERLIPRVLAAAPAELVDPDTDVLDPAAVQAAALRDEKPGGHGERAVAAGILDMAVWDAVAKAERRPLWKSIAERVGGEAGDDRPPAVVKVYAAGGYYAASDESPIPAVVAEMRRYLDLGYVDLKMKIGGAPLIEDLARIEAVLSILPPEGTLAVDANGRFELRTALAYADAMADLSLRWYEEPCDPLDYCTLSALADVYEGPLATGENLLSHPDVVNLLRYGGLRPQQDYLQVDPALSYGLVEMLRIVRSSDRFGWPRRAYLPHGGHQFNLHVAAGLGFGGVEAYPEVFAPFGGFADDQPVESGQLRMSEAPGIGMELKKALHPLLEVLRS